MPWSWCFTTETEEQQGRSVLIYEHQCFLCMCVCALPNRLVQAENSTEQQSSWDWDYSVVDATTETNSYVVMRQAYPRK